MVVMAQMRRFHARRDNRARKAAPESAATKNSARPWRSTIPSGSHVSRSVRLIGRRPVFSAWRRHRAVRGRGALPAQEIGRCGVRNEPARRLAQIDRIPSASSTQTGPRRVAGRGQWRSTCSTPRNGIFAPGRKGARCGRRASRLASHSAWASTKSCAWPRLARAGMVRTISLVAPAHAQREAPRRAIPLERDLQALASMGDFDGGGSPPGRRRGRP